MSAVYTRLKDLLTDKFGVTEEDVSPEATFEDLDLDSLDLVDFSLAVEEEFGARITDEEAAELETLADTVELLYAKLDVKGVTV
jgi:acyl carrier protein